MDKSKLLEAISRFPGKNVAVIGDLMLDVYLWGKVSRISPEAPVPVVNVTRRTSCLGGAGNVLRNLVTLGGSSVAFGLIGEDEDGQELLRQLDGYGVDPAGIAADRDRRTTRKERVMAGNQQLLRLDHEDSFAASEEIRARITSEVVRLVKSGEVDAVIFEDYGKGMLSSAMLEEIVPAASGAGIITALDPKPGSMEPVRGLTVIKPNRKEAYKMAGLAEPAGQVSAGELDEVARRLMEIWAPEYLLISLAAEGMALYDRNGGKSVIPTYAREVFDVSGAGDTVVSAFTLALAAGAEPAEAAAIGNYAAGVVVGKVGTVTVSASELRKQLED